MELGKTIRELRKDKGITQTELAKILSTTQDTISLWELDKSLPNVLELVALAKFFSVSTDYLLGLKEI